MFSPLSDSPYNFYSIAAGDYVKFNFPISSATAVLAWGLAQWRDAYVYAGLLDEMLDSIKWPLDYFLKCWRSGENVYYAQVYIPYLYW